MHLKHRKWKSTNSYSATSADLAGRKVVSPERAAKLLNTSEATLQRWRSTGTVRLPYHKVGPRRVVYLEDELLKFIEDNAYISTSSYANKQRS